MSDNTLERAIQLAAAAHAGQVDKAGEPYILHPLRVMMDVEGEDAQVVAVLHDVVEDTYMTLAFLATNFSSYIIDAVDALSRRDYETYSEYVYRIGKSPLAAQVKLADLKDNMNLGRIDSPSDEDFKRYKKYKKAERHLKNQT